MFFLVVFAVICVLAAAKVAEECKPIIEDVVKEMLTRIQGDDDGDHSPASALNDATSLCVLCDK